MAGITRRRTGPPFSALQSDFMRRQIMSGALPDHPREDDEVHVLRQLTSHVPCVKQRTSFEDLPPELRNRIYEEVIPVTSEDYALIVASRAAKLADELMKKAVQPAITRASKQTRAESLRMFYARNTFAAYVEDAKFTALIDWAHAITSDAQRLPPITVHVYLMDRVACAFSIFDLVESWMQLPPIAHQMIHLKIDKGPLYHAQWDVSFDQRTIVAAAIRLAEKLALEGVRTETRIARHCQELLEIYGVRLVSCDGLETMDIRDWQWKHANGRRCKGYWVAWSS